MEVRAYKPEDVEEAKRIFDKFYAKDNYGSLTFPDMTNEYLCAFTILGNDDKIITTGGVRVIAEITLITDKNRAIKERVLALREVLKISSFIAREFRFDRLHAVTDDPTWANQMQEVGFMPRGQDLEIEVRDVR